MGKGNRNKLDRYQGRIETPEEYLANRRKLNKKQKNKSGLGITITCIVLVAVIVLTLVGVFRNYRAHDKFSYYRKLHGNRGYAYILL